MASSLFGKMQNNSGTSQVNNLFNTVNQIRNMISQTGNPNAVVSQLSKVNPQFANFLNQNKGKSIEQVCTENGIDYSAFMKALGRRN